MTERSKKLDLALGPFPLALISISRRPWALGCLGRTANWLEKWFLNLAKYQTHLDNLNQYE